MIILYNNNIYPNIMASVNLTLRLIPPQEIRIDQLPTDSRWTLTPLYKISADGSLLFWQIGYDGTKLNYQQGYVEGVITTEMLAVIDGNQAIIEARRQYKLKYRDGYQLAGNTVCPMIKCMKGMVYKNQSLNWNVYTQPKLHGIRMLCQDVGTGRISMRSWTDNAFTHLTHLESELKILTEYLPRYATLDGELYNHTMTFSQITSAIKTTKTIHPLLHQIQYWIFDIQYDDPEREPTLEERYELLVNAYTRYIQDHKGPHALIDNITEPSVSNIVIVQSKIARNREEIMRQHEEFVDQGFEGIMIKKIANGNPPGSGQYKDSLYRPGKNSNILKYKNFTDEEGLIISRNPDRTVTIQDKRGNQFPVYLKGCLEPTDVVTGKKLEGKELTYRYQRLSDQNIPINPIGIAIRDYE